MRRPSRIDKDTFSPPGPAAESPCISEAGAGLWATGRVKPCRRVEFPMPESLAVRFVRGKDWSLHLAAGSFRRGTQDRVRSGKEAATTAMSCPSGVESNRRMPEKDSHLKSFPSFTSMPWVRFASEENRLRETTVTGILVAKGLLKPGAREGRGPTERILENPRIAGKVFACEQIYHALSKCRGCSYRRDSCDAGVPKLGSSRQGVTDCRGFVSSTDLAIVGDVSGKALQIAVASFP